MELRCKVGGIVKVEVVEVLFGGFIGRRIGF